MGTKSAMSRPPAKAGAFWERLPRGVSGRSGPASKSAFTWGAAHTNVNVAGAGLTGGTGIAWGTAGRASERGQLRGVQLCRRRAGSRQQSATAERSSCERLPWPWGTRVFGHHAARTPSTIGNITREPHTFCAIM